MINRLSSSLIVRLAPWAMLLGAVLLAEGRNVARAQLAAASTATVGRASEASVKATYLYKFLPYVDWPAGTAPAPGSFLVIAVAGADSVLAELQPLIAGRHVGGHLLAARRVHEGDTLDNVHVLYVGRDADPASLVRRLNGRPVLVISDNRAGLDLGAMLNFVPVSGRVRFEAAPLAAERAGIKLGSGLLSVAERVASR